jgi:phenylalanyl-tRNA synthetase beta chain
LQDFVQTSEPASAIANLLTNLGHEVEAVHESEIGPVLEMKVTPNRGDCLSVLGVARELAAKDAQRFQPTDLMRAAVAGWSLGDESRELGETNVTIEDANLCPRYGARVWKDVKTGPAAEWIQRRLIAAGMRPIDVIVDTTNYVMLELGQPLHAFDLDTLRGRRVVVRTAKAGERILTLDGVDRELDSEMLMICDAERPIAVAGVMGGEETEVTERTRNVLLESAHFNPQSVRRTRRALNLRTEASHRFERYVDPEGVVRALNRFAILYEEQTGCKPCEGLADVYPKRWQPVSVQVREQRWQALLAMDIPRAIAASSLVALGCKVEETADGLQATGPSWRSDLAIEEDFVEEIGRLYGYDRMPDLLPHGSTPQGGESPLTALRSRTRQAMLRLGFIEAVTHTLRAPSPLDGRHPLIPLRNPGSPDAAYLRNSLLPGLAEVALRNYGPSPFLFEIGRVFGEGGESVQLGALLAGRILPEHWSSKQTDVVDFAAAKGCLESLFSHVRREFQLVRSQDERFHPSRQAEIHCGGKSVGVVGQIRADLCEELHLPRESFAFEVSVTDVLGVEEFVPKYRPLSQFPFVRRDMAIEISKDVPYGDIVAAVREAAGELLERVWLFDVYEGQGIPEGKHSLGVAMILRHPEKTLTDEEANEIRERAVASLQRLGAKLR